MQSDKIIREIPHEQPVLIAGPTASGKSALALAIAAHGGGIIINADALQVYQGWPILSAQPDAHDLSHAPHELYGHLPYDSTYSVGGWLADVRKLLNQGPRPIIVGGTGLYFTALTEGLSDIPAIADDIRAKADGLSLAELCAGIDPKTRAGIDIQNRARVQRAWEVQTATGRPLHYWQGQRQAPLIPRDQATALLLDAPKDWLTPRIELRFDKMCAAGAMDEARAMAPYWDPSHLSSRTIGAREMIAHIRGECDLDTVRAATIIGSRQYAKRQRTWFRARMQNWTSIACS